jgi:hypothetical protein
MKQTAKRKTLKHKSRRIIILTLVVIALLVAAGIFWKVHNNQSVHPAVITPASGINYSPSKPSDNTANNDRKGSSSASKTLDNGASSTSVPFSVTVTRAGVFESYLQVGTLVNGATSGTCTLTVAQTGEPSVTHTEAMQAQNNSYACPVFQVPLSEFPNRSSWDVSVTVTSNGKSQSNNWAGNPVFLGS